MLLCQVEKTNTTFYNCCYLRPELRTARTTFYVLGAIYLSIRDAITIPFDKILVIRRHILGLALGLFALAELVAVV